MADMDTVLVVSPTGTGSGTIIPTPGGSKDMLVRAVTPIATVLWRALRTYVQTFVGLVMASVSGSANAALPPGDFLHTLWTCAGLAVVPAIMSILMNLATLMTELGEVFPILKI